MRQLEDFENAHKGEEVIIIGNGPGLKNIPFAFIESRTNFVMNFFSAWVPFIKPDYWLALDPLCFKGAEYVDQTVKFVKAHHAEPFGEYTDNNLVFYKMMDRIKGFQWSDKWGLKYSTTAIAAAHIAVTMGVSKILFVGIDCTHGIGGYQDLENFKGLSRIPHFYDPRYHFTGYSEQWDEHFGLFVNWAAERDVEVINLSIPTLSKNLPKGDYRDYWLPPEQ
ncbi:MAG: hypothetical protein KAS19_06835 [Anaerolineales bacterium]|nr:hypothetical protein [Anaerolineales bacterium]